MGRSKPSNARETPAGVIMTNNKYAAEEGHGGTCSTAFGPIGAAQEPSSYQEYTGSKPGHSRGALQAAVGAVGRPAETA